MIKAIDKAIGLSIVENGLVLVMLIVFEAAAPAYSGSFQFADETHGVDVITHPTGYEGFGGNLMVTVGISPSSPHAAEMEISVQNAIDTWNRLVPTIGNVMTNDPGLPQTQFDFESVVLHELGHCIGLAHPNLASESGLSGTDKNYTRTIKGVNNSFDLDSGADGIIGSSDDIRGDDINLHWFRRADNNPFVIVDEVVDKTTYSRELADLPDGHLFVANGDRNVSALLGYNNTEAVMQQGIRSGESQRSLTADDVATLRLGMSGIDMLAGTADDYKLILRYEGFTDSADIVINFDNKASFSACHITGTFLPQHQNHFIVTDGKISFNTDFFWFFNDELQPPAQEFPMTTVLANNVSDAITLTQGDKLTLEVALDPGLSIGDQADYWVWANTPSGTFWLDSRLAFVRSDSAIRAFGGSLVYLPLLTILSGSTTGLPTGTYIVTFAVDNNKDNVVDSTFQDTVTITINP
ncbi:MAG: hypothetical protein Q8K59_01770 [Nitrosomonas sp.]|nr:hypothetical protein [Nitrosomonas sp.]MDP1949827.1 hypothetical protein [Nitrosomonas sp.]